MFIVQMNPSFLPKSRRNSELSSSKESSFEQQGKGCPWGMVPIQKSQVNDLTKLKSITKLHLGSNAHPNLGVQPGNHVCHCP